MSSSRAIPDLPPKLGRDASEQEKAERTRQMKERRKIQKQQNEQSRTHRDRSDRKQASGAQHRKDADRKERLNKERGYRDRIAQAHLKGALGPNPCPISMFMVVEELAIMFSPSVGGD